MCINSKREEILEMKFAYIGSDINEIGYEEGKVAKKIYLY